MAPEGRLGPHVTLQGEDVDAGRAVDAAGAVGDGDDFPAVQREQLCRPAANVAKALGSRAQRLGSRVRGAAGQNKACQKGCCVYDTGQLLRTWE